ncbi:Transcription initiation factor TFIID subunit A [Musa troglodytarum]|uniref:Transcription initiation factor TFIID subunit A n=1 Tax=Musa troglodytarum TaxID=320322 RepID=A0A9E7JMA1_9LILI|nr:Transcription initiation factor TFIID subunit A [Musa troglodytarum]
MQRGGEWLRESSSPPPSPSPPSSSPSSPPECWFLPPFTSSKRRGLIGKITVGDVALRRVVLMACFGLLRNWGRAEGEDIDPSEKLDSEVEDVLVEIAEDFVESVATFACSLAKHRKSTTLEAKDILLHVERNWNMTLPGYGGDEIKCYKKQFTNDIHKERLAVIRKSMAATGDAANAKNASGGPAAASSKSHAPKAPPIGSPKG